MSVVERLLAPVPGGTYAQQGVAASQPWTADYNIACWVRGRVSAPTRLTLVIRYRDAVGERHVLVDRAECRQDSALLLAGRASIPATGRIELMAAWLQGDPACDVQVDELYVQRIGAQVSEKPIQIAR
jgi:hypothetical protein